MDNNFLDSPIINLIDDIINNAIVHNVSDIHFEPYKYSYRIRYRIDGVLTEVMAQDLIIANRINTRIKIMANLDIAEKRLPQDGHFNMADIDFRVSTCPTIFGEKLVLRLLKHHHLARTLDKLDLSVAQQALIMKYLYKPQGLILVTGPTGSGKTHTLYTMLTTINDNAKNIVSIEDPVEIQLKGVNQITVNNKINLNFATLLRCILRQDPDVIMIGEIRDTETAKIAIDAAQTGHLVLSSLHTNSAAESITRLLNLGVANYNLEAAISLIIAQRLVRKLCNNCKILQDNGSYTAYGCTLCKSGYLGRVALFEFLPMQKALYPQKVMSEYENLYQAGLAQVQAGVTSLAEVNRIVYH
jgi:type IV pilus assembly protein PilB